ncbi:beta-galactosidase trimerization domain-containing protein [uncultured Draconibacterium sp.]|uniref:beta-galactosidase trimerization domain-containing protein n=1 Tax=uncultured Draconibacterium sp. TaxID=1573823 RepID=UPI0025E28223|nr:beta-galactosidase trimerization domain-containing protein [uncultured Draconibacterium sp.]
MAKNLIYIILIGLLAACNGPRINISEIDPGQYDTTWWNRTPVRIFQQNMREIDAQMDIDQYIQSLKDVSANAVRLNVGGIVAFYPTVLKYHWKNEYMQGDLLGTLIKRLHEENIRVIGRFDFSKLNENYAFQKTEWLYKSTSGEFVNYNGQVHTCINGGYQQSYALEILEEAITNYDLDGVFFNMPGYTTRDYSGNYHGICQCEACITRFKDSTDLVLPIKEDWNDPVYREYRKFVQITSAEQFLRVRNFVKELDPKLVINTYLPNGVDILARESASNTRSSMEWHYSASDHVKTALGTYANKTSGNIAISFLDIGFRHVPASPDITRIRLTENLLNAAPLDFACMGLITNQEDRVALYHAKDIYGFNKNHEVLFTNVESKADVCLIKGEWNDYRGIFRILSENHIPFDVMFAEGLLSGKSPKSINDYKLIIVTDHPNMSDELVIRLDEYVENGGKMIVTGLTSTNDEKRRPLNKIRLKSLGVESEYNLRKKANSNYLKIEEQDKIRLGRESYKDMELAYIHSDFLECKLKKGAQPFLKLIPNAMYGPPEKCYYTEVTEIPGMIAYDFGKGKSLYIPFKIGEMYNSKGHHSHSKLIMSSILNIMGYQPNIETDAHELVEITHLKNRNNAFEWVGLINHTGVLGPSFHSPLPINNITLKIDPEKEVKAVKLIRANQYVDFKNEDGKVCLTLPELVDFEMVLFVY